MSINSTEFQGEHYIKVDKVHSIYASYHGNNANRLVIAIHGGPGGHISDEYLRFFNLDKYRVILFDQRGAGKSIPKGNHLTNHTKELIDDIKYLIDSEHKESAILFGGSWGSTLALLFAIKYPNFCESLVLRGLFLATRESTQFFESGMIKHSHPHIWNRMLSLLNDNYDDGDIMSYYYDKILNGTPAEVERYARGFTIYSLEMMHPEKDIEEIEAMVGTSDYLNASSILAQYATNDFFIPHNYICDNVDVIKQLPIYLVHGKFDTICDPELAIRFSKLLDNVVFTLVNGGHGVFDKAISARLSEIMEEL